MKLTFPPDFIFGTSTAATQIETAFEHDWLGVKARDGQVFDRTTDHEKRYDEDVKIITSLAPHYRMNLMWSRLQRAPHSPLHMATQSEYHELLKKLRAGNVSIMLVLHHFANPTWFARQGGWENRRNISLWIDYAKKVVDEFGHYVASWNTFNEPNLYTSMGWLAREFPPFKRNIFLAKRVIQNLAFAHNQIYNYIKEKHPLTKVGISHNCTVFEGDNLAGKLPAKIADWLYMDYAPSLFQQSDFFGMSYYARIGYDPFPVTYLLTPEKVIAQGKDHDDMWEYYPKGLKVCIERYWNEYKKPIIITENGICTNDDTKRTKAISEYLSLIHQCIESGVDVRGYYHWSTWDNFEWSLGPSYRFGLYECNWQTKERRKKPSADLYSQIAYEKTLTL